MEFLQAAEKAKIEARLAELIANRPVISKRIAEARELGDLRENGDYHAAREQQGMEEAEIRRLQDRLANVKVIDERMAKAAEGTIFIGTTVKLKDLGDGEIETYQLVGESSGSASLDIIEVTATSPMGEAMLKKRVGETFRYNAPRGVKQFEVVEIVG